MKFCSLAHLSYLPKNLSDLCAMTTFEFTVRFYRKNPRCLIPTDINSRGMVEQCLRKDSVCLHRAFSTLLVLSSPTMSLWKRLCQGTPAGGSYSGARTLLLLQTQLVAGAAVVLLPWTEPRLLGDSWD